MNELLFIGSLVFYFLCVLLLYRFLGVIGLLAWIPIATILANIEVLKLVPLFGFTEVTLGNVFYASTFLVTDILSENHGKKEAHKAVLLGFVAITITLVGMNLAMAFTPSEVDKTQPLLIGLFTVLPRLALGSLAAYLVSQAYDVWAYDKIRGLFPRFLWLRNNGSTLVSQLLDTSIFCVIAFWGDVPLEVFIQIFISTYVIKALIAVLDTPVLYLARYWKQKGKIPSISQ